MKTKLLILIISLSTASLVMACPGGKGKRIHSGEDKMVKITQELNLTEEQAAQFKIAAEVRKDKMQQAMDNIQAESKAELAQFLTPEQMQLLEEKKEQRQNRKGKRQGKGRGNRGQRNG
jgi:Spy/CpxP family protein refolding chaperone